MGLFRDGRDNRLVRVGVWGMAGRGGGRPWGPIRAQTAEAGALAVFLRAQVDASGLTLTEVAEKVHVSKTQVGTYLVGRVPQQAFVTALITVTVPEPRLRERRQAEAVQLLRAALHPAEVARAAVTAVSESAAVELARVRAQQVETYDRLTRSLEQQAELERAANNSAQLVMVLLHMLGTLERRVEKLVAERDQLSARAAQPRLLEQTQEQLARALDQERRAAEELGRAKEKQRQAEELAARVQEQVDQLTDELDRLRAGDLEGGDVSGEQSESEMGAGRGDGASDPVGDDIDRALARAAAVNDADDQTLQRITDQLHEERHDHEEPQGGGRGAEGRDGEPADHVAGGTRRLLILPDNQDNHPSSVADLLERLPFLARKAYGAGRYNEAARLYKFLASRHARLLGADHPHTLNARNQQARSIGRAGDWDLAVELYKAVVADYVRVLGARHGRTLLVRDHHAFNVGRAGDPTLAAGLYARLADDRSYVLGLNHPDTFRAREDHAFNVGEAGDPALAARLFDAITVDRTRIYGADRLETLRARDGLASNVGRAGDPARAAELYGALADVHTRVHGSDHPGTVYALQRQGYWEGQRAGQGGVSN